MSAFSSILKLVRRIDPHQDGASWIDFQQMSVHDVEQLTRLTIDSMVVLPESKKKANEARRELFSMLLQLKELTVLKVKGGTLKTKNAFALAQSLQRMPQLKARSCDTFENASKRQRLHTDIVHDWCILLLVGSCMVAHACAHDG